MDLTVYTWGSDITFYDQLQAIKMLGHDNYFLVASIYAIAMMVSYYQLVKDENKKGLFRILLEPLIIAQVYIFLFISPSNVNVVIEDELYSRASTVSNPPLGIALLASLSSNLDRSLTLWFESSYSTPNSLAMSQSGLGFSMMAHLNTIDANIKNEDLSETFKYYYHNCIKPDIMNRDKTFSALRGSGDLINDLAPIVEYETLKFDATHKTGIEVSCSESWAYIQSQIPAEAQSYISNDLVAKMKLTANKISDGLADGANLFTGISKTGSEYVQQEMLKNLLKWGQLESAKITGGDVLASAYSKSIADEANYNNWRLAGEQAMQNLPMLKNIYYILFFGITPILAIMSASFRDPKYIMMGVSLIISLSLWQPIGTILNFYYLGELEKLSQAMAYTGEYMNMYKSDALAKKSSAMISMLMNIYTIIPMLAMALLSGGGYALAQAFKSGTGTSAGVNSVSEEMARGNTSIGNSKVNDSTQNNLVSGKKEVIQDGGKHYSNDKGAYMGANYNEIETSNQGTQYEHRDTYGTHSGNMNGVGSVVVGSDGNIKGVSSPHLSEQINSSEKATISELNEFAKSDGRDFAKALSHDVIKEYSSGTSTEHKDTLTQKYGMTKAKAEAMDKTIEEAKVKSLVQSLSTSERDSVIKDLGGSVGVDFKTDEQALGWLGQKLTGVSLNANGGYSYKDVNGQEKTRSLSSDEQKTFKEGFSQKVSDIFTKDESLNRDTAQAVANNETNKDSDVFKTANSFVQKSSEVDTYKSSMQTAKDDITSSGVSVSQVVLDKYNDLRYGERYQNATPEEKLKMSMNSLEEISNPKSDDSISQRLDTARDTVYNGYIQSRNNENKDEHFVNKEIATTQDNPTKFENDVKNDTNVKNHPEVKKINEKEEVKKLDSSYKSEAKKLENSKVKMKSQGYSKDIDDGKKNINQSDLGKSGIDKAVDFVEKGINQANAGSIVNTKEFKTSAKNLEKNMKGMESKIKELSNKVSPKNSKVKEK